MSLSQRLEEAVADQNLDKVAAELAAVVKRYKKHERLDPDKPPTNGASWSVRHGSVEVVRNAQAGGKTIALGVKIGSKFAEPKSYTYPSDDGRKEAMAERKAVVDKLVSDAREILSKLSGGYIENVYGSAHSLLGWIAK